MLNHNAPDSQNMEMPNQRPRKLRISSCYRQKACSERQNRGSVPSGVRRPVRKLQGERSNLRSPSGRARRAARAAAVASSVCINFTRVTKKAPRLTGSDSAGSIHIREKPLLQIRIFLHNLQYFVVLLRIDSFLFYDT